MYAFSLHNEMEEKSPNLLIFLLHLLWTSSQYLKIPILSIVIFAWEHLICQVLTIISAKHTYYPKCYFMKSTNENMAPRNGWWDWEYGTRQVVGITLMYSKKLCKSSQMLTKPTVLYINSIQGVFIEYFLRDVIVTIFG